MITEGVPFDQLAVVECLAIGAHSVRRGEVSKNDTIMVLGAGTIGLGTAQFAKVAEAACPEVQRWETLMWQFHQALPWAKDGEKWLPMEELLKLTEQP
ncbi:L-rhamnose mutarotase [Colwellia sp. TT2012]|uniref:L-rhamnose mutarotase n=1 Tax=Colwellia sp. TT2012 TaxID=1720342 RepID=UPI00070D76F7|nr:L-rhamnose mutarotase [Colwellia sp. TT2012]